MSEETPSALTELLPHGKRILNRGCMVESEKTRGVL